MASTRTLPEPVRRTPAAGIPVVEFRDVSKVYDGGSVGLERASMRIDRGEFVFLVGPTGCGKSTCIRLLQKELEASAGEILIAGRELVDPAELRLVSLAEGDGDLFTRWRLAT